MLIARKKCNELEPKDRALISNVINNLMRIVWRLNKKQDFYLLVLLSCPNREFSFEELYFYRYASDEFINNHTSKKVDVNSSDVVENQTNIEMVDRKTIIEIQRRIKELSILLSTKKRKKEECVSKVTLSKELKHLLIYQKDSISKYNKNKFFQTRNLKIRKMIIKNIRMSLFKLQMKDAEMAKIVKEYLVKDKKLGILF